MYILGLFILSGICSVIRNYF